MKQKCFHITSRDLRRNKSVDRSSLSSVGSLFHARGAATEKALSPIRRRVRGTTRLPHDVTDMTWCNNISKHFNDLTGLRLCDL